MDFKSVCILVGGPTRTISVDGRPFRFEMHPTAGPAVVDHRDVIIKQPGPRHRFWEAVSLWAQQGQRLDDNGLCIWNEKDTPITEHIGGRHHRIIGMQKGKPGS